MHEKIIIILNKYFDENYAAFPNRDGTSSVIFFIPYQPYADLGEDKIFIDSYYKASNRLYHKTNDLIQELNDNGIKAERSECNLKAMAIRSGLAAPTHTTLVAAKEFGTKIVLGMIVVDGELEKLRSTSKLCDYCYKCIKACPTGALSAEGFDRGKCIRQLQLQSAECIDEYAQLMGNKVMGCDLCQRACRLNACIKEEPVSIALERYMDVDYLLLCSRVGKEALAQLEPFIGKNYLRPNKILALALNASSNMGHYLNINLAKDLINSHDKAISINAKRLIDSYNNRQ